jgi:glutathione-specific gamma-glutamylcyclotransferase
MSLTRTKLSTGYLKQLLQQSPELRAYILDEAELQASIRRTLQKRSSHSDVWIFAYGSLIWNPLLQYCDRVPGKIYGWHRCFCLRTPLGRGTPEKPGLVLGLEAGGSCRGVAYRIAREHVSTELSLLWHREMLVGSYIPRWVKVLTEETLLDAIVFTINPKHPLYAPKLSLMETAAAIAVAHGALGSCSDYLSQTIKGLAEHNIIDRSLLKLQHQVTTICN